jgi:hypothetical protein
MIINIGGFEYIIINDKLEVLTHLPDYQAFCDYLSTIGKTYMDVPFIGKFAVNAYFPDGEYDNDVYKIYGKYCYLLPKGAELTDVELIELTEDQIEWIGWEPPNEEDRYWSAVQTNLERFNY